MQRNAARLVHKKVSPEGDTIFDAEMPVEALQTVEQHEQADASKQNASIIPVPNAAPYKVSQQTEQLCAYRPGALNAANILCICSLTLPCAVRNYT